MLKQSHPRILLVDSPDLVIQTQRLLEETGYQVFCCATAAEGLRTMEREKIDLIILDLILVVGEISGYEMCLQIKQDSRWKNIPIILLCDQRIPIEIGMNYRNELEASTLILKPVNMNRLCLEIRSLVKAP